MLCKTFRQDPRLRARIGLIYLAIGQGTFAISRLAEHLLGAQMGAFPLDFFLGFCTGLSIVANLAGISLIGWAWRRKEL